MIHYDGGAYGILLLLRCKGSVFAKGVRMSLPSSLFAIGSNFFWKYCAASGVTPDSSSATEFNLIWSGYTFILGFLIVFRSQLAYSRFWEGAVCLSKVQATWTNAVSNLVAFSSRSEAMKPKVQEFQEHLSTLMSMLFCESLREVMPGDGESDVLETLSAKGIDAANLRFLDSCPDKSVVILQWVQRLIVEADDDKTIDIAPPILSRVFQELSNGVVTMKQASNVAEVQLPFPYSQLVAGLIVLHTILTPIVAGYVINSWWNSAMLTFFVMQSIWCLQITAIEIDQPFGQDPNDLPVVDMMNDFNRHLVLFLQPSVAQPPVYTVQDTIEVLAIQGRKYGKKSAKKARYAVGYGNDLPAELRIGTSSSLKHTSIVATGSITSSPGVVRASQRDVGGESIDRYRHAKSSSTFVPHASYFEAESAQTSRQTTQVVCSELKSDCISELEDEPTESSHTDISWRQDIGFSV